MAKQFNCNRLNNGYWANAKIQTCDDGHSLRTGKWPGPEARLTVKSVNT